MSDREIVVADDARRAYFQAGMSSTSLELLESLAQSSCPKVRARVAENQSSSHDLLELLSNDSDADVRIAVGRNPEAPTLVHWTLAFDEHLDVRFSLAENAQTDLLILIWLTGDENPYIAHRAMRTLNAVASGDGNLHSKGESMMAAKTIERTLRRMLNTKERLNKVDAIQLRSLILEDGFLSKSEKKVLHNAIEDDLLDDEAIEIFLDLLLDKVDGRNQAIA